MNYKEKIRSKGLKFKWVAEQIGISNVLLSWYLNGVRQMPLHIEEKIKEIIK